MINLEEISTLSPSAIGLMMKFHFKLCSRTQEVSSCNIFWNKIAFILEENLNLVNKQASLHPAEGKWSHQPSLFYMATEEKRKNICQDK